MKKFMLLLTVACWAGMATAQIQQSTGNEAYTDIYKEYTDDPDMRIYTSNIDF